MSRFHDILGVRPGASEQEIKNAFRERALECHPDRAAEDRKEEAQEEFVRVREAFEVLSDGESRRARDATRAASDNGSPSSGRRGRRRRSYKEAWKDYKNQKVRISRDIVDGVGGLSTEYDQVREKNRITVPLCSLAAVGIFVYDPMTIYGTGVYLVDVVLCGLVGSVYGFVLGSIWAYLDLFVKDFVGE